MMQKNRYQKLTESIHTPAGLNDRVLLEARRREVSGRVSGRRGRPVFRTVVCAACALALLLGGISLRPATTAGTSGGAAGGGEPDILENVTAPALVPTFGLTAYAAETQMSYGPAEDGGIAFAIGEGMTNPGEGDFTGCLFQITGENIVRVSLSIDRGGLYRYQPRENLTAEQMAEYRQAMSEGRLTTAAISRREDGTWYMPEMTPLGEAVQEDYDPEARYGFWVPPEEMAPAGLGITIEARMDADFFDGAALTVTVTSSDGTERTRVYRLHSGELKVEWHEDQYLTVLPELAGPDDPYVYGIYAVPED